MMQTADMRRQVGVPGLGETGRRGDGETGRRGRLGGVPGLGETRDKLPDDLGGPERANRKAAERRRRLCVRHSRW